MEEDADVLIDYSTLKPGLKRFPSFMERYTTQYFYTGVNPESSEDEWVCQHSNKLILVGIASTHPILTVPGRTVTKVDFAASGSREKNLLDVKVSGKGKKGAVWMQPDSVLCEVTMSDGAVYKIRSGVRGMLIEANPRIAEDPELIRKKPATEGYVAILRPRMEEVNTVTSKLLTKEQFYKLKKI